MSAGSITNTFRAFRNRNYTLFFSGQSISQIGTWMQRSGMYWVVFTMTNSAFWVSVTMFATQFPSFVFSLYGGIIADRYNRYRILLVTQVLSMIQALVLAVLVLTHHYNIWVILLLGVMLGIINAFDVPARQPLIHDLVNDKDDLPNALAMNSAMNNLSRIAGPALSGFVLVTLGAGICFLINAVSFIAVLVSLVLMKLPAYVPAAVKKELRSELSESFAYLKKTPSISTIILMLALMSLFVLPYDPLLPVFAKNIFKGDARTYGFITGAIGVGAILSTVYMASMKAGTDFRKVLMATMVVLGLGFIAFSRITYLPLALIFAVVAGFGTMSNTICLTIVQVNTTPAMRGRVMSYVAMAVFGMLPLGSLLIGAVSQKIGPQNTMLGQGIMALVIMGLFFKFLTNNKEQADKLTSQNKEQLIETESEVTETH